MPTQRPFLGNFLAAFRAHSQPLPKTSASISSSAVAAASTSVWTAAPQQAAKSASAASENSTSSPKPIHPKTNSYGAQSTTAQPERQLVSSYTPLEHSVSPLTHLPRSPPSPGLLLHGPQNKPPQSYPTVQDVHRSRRGSDSSTEGYREVRARGEKWFIGGLTATGEERYYKLSMVKRDKSSDRISTDQMSL